jgi:XRE family transcriptional regulator, aerobic/anaerobic benzoate catabolism transcriptional regulator
LRPMAASAEAMADLELILADRSPFYAKANFSLMTSGQTQRQAFAALKRLLKPPKHAK